jgi:hypothetical protein
MSLSQLQNVAEPMVWHVWREAVPGMMVSSVSRNETSRFHAGVVDVLLSDRISGRVQRQQLAVARGSTEIGK